MKALLFGAAGQVGRALRDTAPPEIEIVALDRTACDIGEPERIEAAIAAVRPDLVLNAAAYTQVDKAEEEPEAARRLNAVAPGIMARAAHAAGARMVHFSTDFVFDGEAGRPYRPEDPTGPVSSYGQSKLEGEKAVTAAAPDALIIRTAWVYAARGANFVNTMIRLMGERDQLRVVSDQVGTPTFANSLARTTWRLVENRAVGVHHFTDSGVASWYDFAVAIEEEARALGLLDRKVAVEPISTDEFPTPARRPAYSVLDKSATWQALGTVPPHWRANLREMLKELKDIG